MFVSWTGLSVFQTILQKSFLDPLICIQLLLLIYLFLLRLLLCTHTLLLHSTCYPPKSYVVGNKMQLHMEVRNVKSNELVNSLFPRVERALRIIYICGDELRIRHAPLFQD